MHRLAHTGANYNYAYAFVDMLTSEINSYMYILNIFSLSVTFQLRLERVDMSSFQSIREFVDRIKEMDRPIDYLVNNAGVLSPTYEESADGHELSLAVNYLGPVLLTELLLPEMMKAPMARIVNVSSMLHFNGSLYKPTLHLVGADYGPYLAYSQSKLALTMYTVELGKRLEGTSVTAVSLHPGTVKTELTRNSNSMMDVSITYAKQNK
ncbi:unnamed protein product [Echinostoma caproni]|uniref:Uncharacterized protein n=1 Tax=Echinostoma caproni TaxID=27848 RepID=A0A3P8GIM8_9TREM|nr:unnamed protein product [Echinostoma caproni]